jgi:hypothetical protein
MTAARIGGSIAWSVIMLLSVGVGGYAFFLVATGFRYLGIDNTFPTPLGLEIHITASALAMLLGPFQFLKLLRSRFPAVHRWTGRIYVSACLVGGVAGATVALYSAGGLPAGLGFLSLAILWLASTAMAWISAMRRDFGSHERWMIRSFALTLAAVTLRLYLPVSIISHQGQFWVPDYQIIAWICWVPNLIIAEMWIAMRKRPRRPPGQPKPASAEAPA